MVLKDIIARLQHAAPEDFAEEWDNVGLLVGDRRQEIHAVYIALDADEAAIAQAKAVGAELLLTHHPLIFSPLKKINRDHFISARVVELLQSHMSCYAMHTNFDIARMGLLAAERIDMLVEKPLADTFTRDGKDYGIGAVGMLREPMLLRELAELVKQKFDLPAVKVFGEQEISLKRAAICPGSGKSTIADAIAAGAQVLITGDIDHHSGIDAVAQDLCIIDAGHYGLEHIFIGYMEQYLKEKLTGVKIYAQKRSDPFIMI